MNKSSILLLLILASPSIFSQRTNFKEPDSLSSKDYVYLDDRIFEFKKDSSKAAVYLFAYLHKAKNEQNWKEIVNAYQNIIYQSPSKLKIIYADSMIFAGKKTNDNAIVGSAYLSKGIVYYGEKQQILALDNYLLANNYISKTNDKYLIYKVKYHMALVKYYLGFYDEAISLLNESITYFKEKNPRAYLNSLHFLGLCYNKIGNYGLCSETNSLGISESKRLDLSEMKGYFIQSEGINEYFKNNFELAIKNIESSLNEITESKDFANESISNFYIGKSYWSLNKKEKALPYFLKVDKNFNDKKYIRPDLREVYEILITYFKGKKDLKMQLYYIDQLLKADTQLHETYRYLIGKIHKEYDTKELLNEKEKIQSQLNQRKYYDYILVIVILFLFPSLLILTYRHFKLRKVYKQRFDELMSKRNNENPTISKEKITKPEILDINPDAISTILNQLEKFERDQKFLEKNINLINLSATFKTNTKYLSKVISHYRDKGFVEYINDLKIDYVIDLLKNDRKARKYTNTALAEEAGFSSTQRFATAFFANTKMPTSFFIDQIKKD
nr:AraC family transcriptional regulator [uncultured Flavobacterium sp.]